jgi:hypothetical protein
VYKCCWGLCWKVTKVLYWLNKPFLSNSNLSRYLLNDPRIKEWFMQTFTSLPNAAHYHSCSVTTLHSIPSPSKGNICYGSKLQGLILLTPCFPFWSTLWGQRMPIKVDAMVLRAFNQLVQMYTNSHYFITNMYFVQGF